MTDYFICPNCGAEVTVKALSCPECGSDEKTGWSEDTMYDGLDLPAFEETRENSSKSMFQNKFLLYIVGIMTILAFIWFFVM
ncbi:MAG: zinc-ribbon domain-containing protein [Candidatus Scalindua sp.]